MKEGESQPHSKCERLVQKSSTLIKYFLHMQENNQKRKPIEYFYRETYGGQDFHTQIGQETWAKHR